MSWDLMMASRFSVRRGSREVQSQIKDVPSKEKMGRGRVRLKFKASQLKLNRLAKTY